MKLTIESRPREHGEYIDRESLVELGRQLHSKAIFEMWARMFQRDKNAKTDFSIEGHDRRLADSH